MRCRRRARLVKRMPAPQAASSARCSPEGLEHCKGRTRVHHARAHRDPAGSEPGRRRSSRGRSGPRPGTARGLYCSPKSGEVASGARRPPRTAADGLATSRVSAASAPGPGPSGGGAGPRPDDDEQREDQIPRSCRDGVDFQTQPRQIRDRRREFPTHRADEHVGVGAVHESYHCRPNAPGAEYELERASMSAARHGGSAQPASRRGPWRTPRLIVSSAPIGRSWASERSAEGRRGEPREGRATKPEGVRLDHGREEEQAGGRRPGRRRDWRPACRRPRL